MRLRNRTTKHETRSRGCLPMQPCIAKPIALSTRHTHSNDGLVAAAVLAPNLWRDMSIKQTTNCCAVKRIATKTNALALAATMALSGGIAAASTAAFADEATGSAATTISISSVIDQAVAQSIEESQPAMEDVATEFITQQKKAAAKAAKKAKAFKASKVGKTLTTANKYKGTPYVYGGSTPAGFDCSGFTMYCYGKAGVSLTHNAQAQYNQTRSVSTASMKKGDLVFFGSSTSSITHVGIYVGDGKFIHSPRTGETVRVDNLSSRSNFVGATRVVE